MAVDPENLKIAIATVLRSYANRVAHVAEMVTDEDAKFALMEIANDIRRSEHNVESLREKKQR